MHRSAVANTGLGAAVSKRIVLIAGDGRGSLAMPPLTASRMLSA